MQTLLLAGLDRDAPFVGRTDAVYLVFYHPRLARASLLALPPDLFVYIPGYTMQRLNTAYAVGGIEMLSTTIQYNFGVQPDSWAVVNAGSFSNLINDLNGLEITFLKPIPEICDGFSAGTFRLHGEQVLCIFRYRSGDDESSRSQRQQEILRLLFLRFVENGGLVRLPELYQKYRHTIDTNFTLVQATGAFPLLLRLGDPNRVAYYHAGADELEVWEITDRPITRVFLPRRPQLRELIQEAVNFIATPAPLSDIVLTLAAQLTVSPTPTRTPIYTLTRTATSTPFPTFTPPRPSITPTGTLTPTPDLSASPTITGTLPTSTPTVTGTPPTATFTVTGTPPTVTPTLTPSPTPTRTPTPTPE
jgi:LCP family protein required for cell wall assembly